MKNSLPVCLVALTLMTGAAYAQKPATKTPVVKPTAKIVKPTAHTATVAKHTPAKAKAATAKVVAKPALVKPTVKTSVPAPAKKKS